MIILTDKQIINVDDYRNFFISRNNSVCVAYMGATTYVTIATASCETEARMVLKSIYKALRNGDEVYEYKRPKSFQKLDGMQQI